MPTPDLADAAAPESPPGNLVEAGVYPSFAAAFEHSIVVLAMGKPCWLLAGENGHRLLVEPQVLEAAHEQLACFDRESVGWPPPPATVGVPRHELVVITPLLWSVAVLAAYRLQDRRPDWTASGTLDAQAVFDRGEWWRAATALFLHGDPGHVIANALSGILAFSAVLTTFGLRLGWLLIALAAVAGNLAVAAVNHPGPYHSLGASTAIFAGLGLLTGRAVRTAARSAHPHRWRTIAVPLAAGLTVLGLYGAGGLQIDVGAHLTGFTCGLVLGFLAAPAAAGARTAPAKPHGG